MSANLENNFCEVFGPNELRQQLSKYSYDFPFAPLVRVAQYLFFGDSRGRLSETMDVPKYVRRLEKFCAPDAEGYLDEDSFDDYFDETPFPGVGGLVEIGLLAQYLIGAIEMSGATETILFDELWGTRKGAKHVPRLEPEDLMDSVPHLHSFISHMFATLDPGAYRRLQYLVGTDIAEIEFLAKLAVRGNEFHPTLALLIFEKLASRCQEWRARAKEDRFGLAGLSRRRAASHFSTSVVDRDARIFVMNRGFSVSIPQIIEISHEDEWAEQAVDSESMARQIRKYQKLLKEYQAFQFYDGKVSRKEEHKNVPLCLTFESYFSKLMELSPAQRTQRIGWIFDIDGRD